jgi:hypothetical protein
MALPRQSTAIYTTTIPSTEKSVKFRPFLVKEEKALLIAQQSEDRNVMVDTLKVILADCLVDKIDIESLAMFDLEYLLLQIRAKSIGEIAELIFSCDDCIDPKAKVKIAFDLTTIHVVKDPTHAKKINLFDDVGIVMKYPNIDEVYALSLIDLDNVEAVFDLIISSIEYIYDGDEIYHTKEQTKTEVEEFINNLTQQQFRLIEVFFETMPKLRQDVKFSCPVCSKEHNKYIEGIESFF